MPTLDQVPDIVVGRLPIYLRALTHLLEEGERVIASRDLAQRLGISPAQIRKDLSYFGEFGKQGMGYDIAYLSDQLRAILKVDREWTMALAGAGDLGHAVVHYWGFERWGYQMCCVFDNDPRKIGSHLGPFEILDAETMSERIRREGIKIGIVAVPAAAAQKVVDQMLTAGVRAILNYAPVTVTVPEDVQVQYMDPVIHLQHMTYYL